MDVLEGKGAGSFSGVAKNRLVEAAPKYSESRWGNGRAEQVVRLTAYAVALVGMCLMFYELPMTGLTWDEWLDYDIARDYLMNQSYLTNLDDPSQGRLSHLVASASFELFGVSYRTFKLPFVLIGIGGGISLWWFLSSLVRPVVSALVVAAYFSCPYVLAACRTGATAGDAIVMVATLGFVITMYHWLRSNCFWPHGAACGLICGLAIGAKWTSALLLLAVTLLWLSELARQRRWQLDRPIWVSVLAHQGLAVGTAFIASPTLMLGVPFVKSALGHSLKFTGMALMQFGRMRTDAPWYYVPAVLISKYSVPQVLLVAWELTAIAVLWAQKQKKVGRLPLVCLASLLPMVPLALKGFQNAHYYVATVPTFMILSALAVERWLRSPHAAVRNWTLWLGAAAVLGQMATAIYLSPDYLLSGRQYGKRFYGQFAGPAVNHCQGLPFAIREMNRLIETEGAPTAAYVLRSCVEVMQHAAEHGPIVPLARIAAHPEAGVTGRHILIVPGSYDYDNLGEAEQTRFVARKQKLVANCRLSKPGHVDYELWLCPGDPR